MADRGKKKGPVSSTKPQVSPFEKKVRRIWGGHPDLDVILRHRQHIILYGETRDRATFTCATCGDTCLCCEGARVYTSVEAIAAHIRERHPGS